MSVTLRCLVFEYSLFVGLVAHEQQFPLCSACCLPLASKSFAGPTRAVAIAIAIVVAIMLEPMQSLIVG